MSDPVDSRAERSVDFIREFVQEDLAAGRFAPPVITRFPPEPNGYLHIGHAKSIIINFGIARDFDGCCHLRFDDTNPMKEDREYIDAILDDVRWLGCDWGDHLYYASDVFGKMCDCAVQLIRAGKAYVCDLAADQVTAHRGTLTTPGRPSPSRDRSVEENLDLFARMRAGEFPDGAKTLRAKIDMAHPNLIMRDPVMFRIIHALHPHVGDAWCIYPTYDWAHGLEDSFEGVTHSICTLEFENHRPLYDWFLENLGLHHPRQIEFARLNLTYTVMSKRKLLELVKEKLVSGWDDPRLPTLRGMRRRGFPPEAIRDFCERIGVAKRDSVVDVQLLEHCVREELNVSAPRAMAILKPLRVVLVNYPEDQVEEFVAENLPGNAAFGTHVISFCRELWIERDDFREEAPKKFFRLAPGAEVRLKHAYIIRCEEVVKDTDGNVIEVRCSYDPTTRGGEAPAGKKIQGTLHWVSARHGVPAVIRVYDHLFTRPDPDAAEDYRSVINSASLDELEGFVEPMLGQVTPGARYQFLRQGYFCADPDSVPGRPVFNRTVTLKDSWAKIVLKSVENVVSSQTL